MVATEIGGAVMAGTIADAVRRARLGRRWSQEKLAELIGTDQTTVSQIERGKFKPTYSTVLALASAFDVQPGPWVELAGYRVTGGERGALVADEFPAWLVALMREMVRQYPELASQFQDRRADADFPAQVRTLARILGFTAKEWLDESP